MVFLEWSIACSVDCVPVGLDRGIIAPWREIQIPESGKFWFVKIRNTALGLRDHFTFLGNYPPIPLLSRHFALSEKEPSVNVGLGKG